MLIHLRYCMLTASFDCNIDDHPQQVMKRLGITYQHATPQSIGDQWWFWNCENIPHRLPIFLSKLDVDPMECIGWGLSLDHAIKIMEYKKHE